MVPEEFRPDGPLFQKSDGTFYLTPVSRARLEAEGLNLTPGEQTRENQTPMGFGDYLNQRTPDAGGAGFQYDPVPTYGPLQYAANGADARALNDFDQLGTSATYAGQALQNAADANGGFDPYLHGGGSSATDIAGIGQQGSNQIDSGGVTGDNSQSYVAGETSNQAVSGGYDGPVGDQGYNYGYGNTLCLLFLQAKGQEPAKSPSRANSFAVRSVSQSTST